MVEFYLILSAVQPNIGAGMFWRLLVGTVVMFAGEAGSVAASGDKVGVHMKTSFDTMRFIVTVGWSIYPLGYFFGYLMGQVNDDVLNLVYNLADFVNKIAFCLAIWQSAKRDTSERSSSALLAGSTYRRQQPGSAGPVAAAMVSSGSASRLGNPFS